MKDIAIVGSELVDAHLLGIAGSFLAGATEINPVDTYVRADDVVAVYEEPPPADVRVDALWRCSAGTSSDNVLGVVDLIVSVRTQSLDCRPDVSVQSRLVADETLQLRIASPTAWERLAIAPSPRTIDPQTGTGCLLFRLPDFDLTYAEMIHPLDFQGDEVSAEEGEKRVRILRRLFRTHLEKGVILRARVRGAFVNRHDDCETAAECYAAFAAADPPLGT